MLINTGRKKLVERSPHDNYWGDGGDGRGMNHLGELLMKVREVITRNELGADVDKVPSSAFKEHRPDTSKGKYPLLLL